MYDKAADADWLRDSTEARGVELICPNVEDENEKLARTDTACVAIATGGSSNERSDGFSTIGDSSLVTNITRNSSKDS